MATEQKYTQTELNDAVAEACNKLHAFYDKAHKESINRAKSAEDNAVKNIGLLQQAEKTIAELEARVGRRNRTITELKAEIYDVNQVVSMLIKVNTKGLEVDTVCKAVGLMVGNKE